MEPTGELARGIGELAAMGLMVWVVKRVFSHTIPRLAEDFRKALERQQEVFTSALETLRAAFSDEMRQQRKELFEELRDARFECRACREKIGELTKSVESR